jgi:hypothetical protein
MDDLSEPVLRYLLKHFQYVPDDMPKDQLLINLVKMLTWNNYHGPLSYKAIANSFQIPYIYGLEVQDLNTK